MKKVLSEKNLAGLLFILVLIAFAFAHEDSKRRSNIYNTSIQSKPKPELIVSKNSNGSVNSNQSGITK